jgi:hypothetical protein
MSGQIKLACPGCRCVVFEPQNHLDTLSKYSCVSCGRAEPVAVWKIAGLTSERGAAWWIEFGARLSRSRLLAAEIKARAQAVVSFYAGGFSA